MGFSNLERFLFLTTTIVSYVVAELLQNALQIESLVSRFFRLWPILCLLYSLLKLTILTERHKQTPHTQANQNKREVTKKRYNSSAYGLLNTSLT